MTDPESDLVRRAACATSLWNLLDSIDTLDDQLKPNTWALLGMFRRKVLDLVKLRHKFLVSDGYRLTLPDGEAAKEPMAERPGDDDQKWIDRITELFHPDMNWSNIHVAIVALLGLFAAAKRVPIGSLHSDRLLGDSLDSCKELLWENVPTQLEKELRAAEIAAGVDCGPFPCEVPARSGPLAEHDAECQRELAALFPKDMSWGQIRDAVKELLVRDERVRRFATRPETQMSVIIERAIQEPKLEEALAIVSLYDTENAVVQALRNVPEDNRKTAHGGLWETFARGYMRQVLERWGILHALQRDEKQSQYTFQETARSDSELKYEELQKGIVAMASGEPFKCLWPGHQSLLSPIADLFNKAHEALRAPVPMLLSCPACHKRHVDRGEFATKPHKDHSCQHCGVTWRPAKVPTVGVQFLPGYKDAPRGEELVGRRVRLLSSSSEHLVLRFDGPYLDEKQERYIVLLQDGMGEARELIRTSGLQVDGVAELLADFDLAFPEVLE